MLAMLRLPSAWRTIPQGFLQSCCICPLSSDVFVTNDGQILLLRLRGSPDVSTAAATCSVEWLCRSDIARERLMY